MSTLKLIKMHGCENDYLFVDCFTQPPPQDPGTLSRRLSARHTGIGSDGLVLMRPPSVPGADALMEIYNADGSVGAMCGNALRCYVFWLHQTGRATGNVRIQMAERLIEGRILSEAPDRRSAQVSVRIGCPQSLELAAAGMQQSAQATLATQTPSAPSAEEKIPKVIAESVRAIRAEDVRHHGRQVTLHCLSMGNPHAVVFVKQIESIEFLRLGPIIERHPLFTDRTNVEFATVTGSNEARVRVWERGSGETRACGSGACAVAAAGIATGWFSMKDPVKIHMNGGTLQVVAEPDGGLLLEGEAVEVAKVSVAV